MLVLELARCEWVDRRENVIALGPSGTGKTHVALGLGLAACQKGMNVGFTTAEALVNELMEARDERRLLRVQKQMANVKLLIIPSRTCKHVLPGNGRIGLRPSIQNRGGTPLRVDLAAIRTGGDTDHLQPAVR